jgi:hypothetical protein
MSPRLALLVTLALTAACEDEATPSPDAGMADGAVAAMMATDAAADAPASPPDMLGDAAADRPENDLPPAACDPAGRQGTCLDGFAWGCCGDVGRPMFCVGGTWQCPAGTVESTKCCGSGPGCLRESFDPRCDSKYTDAGNWPIGQ